MAYDETILHGTTMVLQTMMLPKQSEAEENSNLPNQASYCFLGNLDSPMETKTPRECVD